MTGRAFRQAGFTLVELLTVIAIMAILMSLSTLFFSQMQKKSNIEKEVSTIYTTLMSVRLEALYGKTGRAVKLNGSQLNIYPGTDTTVAPVSTTTLTYPVVLTGGADQVTFDSRGISTATDPLSICVATTGSLQDNDGNVDSVTVELVRIYMGKRRSGGACVSSSIDQK